MVYVVSENLCSSMAEAVDTTSPRAAFVEASVPFAMNMASSVGLIAVNKVLMSSFGFVWGEQRAKQRAMSAELKHPRSCDTLWSSLCNHCAVRQPHEEGGEREACGHPFPRRVTAAFLCTPSFH